MCSISHIVCVDKNYGIGYKGKLLCEIPEDLRHFRNITLGSAIVMGRKTFESLPNGPLKGRVNIVVSSTMPVGEYDGYDVVSNIEDAIKVGLVKSMNEKVFIIGGGELYKKTVNYVDSIYITRVYKEYKNVDTYYPRISCDFKQVGSIKQMESSGYKYCFETYVRR